MGAEPNRRILWLLRAAAIAGAAAAFLMLAPDQAHAADPLAGPEDAVTAIQHPLGDAANPIVDGANPVVEATRPVTEPVVEAAEPIADPVVEATRPVTEPVVEPTDPIVEDIGGRLEPILDPIPSVAAPGRRGPAAQTRAALDLHAAAAATEAERVAPLTPAAPLASVPVRPSMVGRIPATGPATGQPAPSTLAGLASPGSDVLLAPAGDALLIALIAGSFLGIVAGSRRLSFGRLRLPAGLVLAPPVPPG